MKLATQSPKDLVGNCLRCSRRLTNPVSMYVGFGPVCSAHLGIERPEYDELVSLNPELPEHLEKLRQVRGQLEARNNEEKNKEGSVTLDDTEIIIKFKWGCQDFDRIKDTVKAYGGRWHPYEKEWTVAKSRGRELAEALKQFQNLTLDEELFDLPLPQSQNDPLPEHEEPSQPGYCSLTADKKMLAISFDIGHPEFKTMKDAVKNLRARWQPENKVWVYPLNFKNTAKIIGLLNDYGVEIDPDIPTTIATLTAQQEQSLEASVATDADITIPGLNGSLYPFQKAGVLYAVEKEKVLIADEMGCISGNAMISLNRAGKGFKIKLSDAYKRFHGLDHKHWNWDSNIPTYARTLTQSGELRLNCVIDILNKGIQEVVELQLESGKSIVLTPDHEVITSDYLWTETQNLCPGSEILTNGKPVCKECGSSEDIITYKYAKFRGYCCKCMYRIKRAKPTYKNGKCVDSDGYIRLSGYFNHPRANHGQVYEHIIVMENHLGRLLDWPQEQIHHINGDKTDNRFKNLTIVNTSEHHTIHHKHLNFNGDNVQFLPIEDKVKSVKNAGTTNVYDVVMADPNHNFVANNIIVHNCGKTVQAIAWLQASHLFPAVIIVPASLKLNWEREINHWLPDKKVAVLSGLKPTPAETHAIQNSDVTVLNYDIICDKDPTKHPDAGRLGQLKQCGFRAIILDESHYIKNRKAIRTKAVMDLRKSIPFRLCLTGTPVLNRPNELIQPLSFLNRLNELGGFWGFVKRYCNATQTTWGWDMSGASNLKELNRKLRETCMVRRQKADVLTELPAKQRVFIPVELDSIHRAKYQDAVENFVFWMEELKAKKLKEKAKNVPPGTVLETVWLTQPQYNPSYPEQLVKIEILKQLAAKGKLATVKEWITDFLETGEKLVVFAHHKEIIADLAKHFAEKCTILVGDTPMQERQAAVDKFQSDPDCQLFIGSTKAAGVGITLTAASNVAFVEFGWTPADHDQAEDRCHRISQKNSVTAWYFIAEGTIENDIRNLILQKRSVVNLTTNGTEKTNVAEKLLDNIVKSLLEE